MQPPRTRPVKGGFVMDERDKPVHKGMQIEVVEPKAPLTMEELQTKYWNGEGSEE